MTNDRTAPLSGPKRQHLGYLDVYRALAVAGVVLTHAVRLGHFPKGMPAWLDNVSHFGAKGVMLFFATSGMSLALNYSPATFQAREFYIRRFFRIAPFYYLATVTYLILGLTILPQVMLWNNSPLNWLLNLTFLNGWTPATINSLCPGAWTIAAEMTFYLCFPLLLRLKDAPRWLLAVTLGTYLLSVGCYHLISSLLPASSADDSSFAYFFWLTQLPAFASGVCCVAWMPHLARYRRLGRIIFPLSLLTIALLSLTRGPSSSYVAADIVFSVFVLSGAISGYKILDNAFLGYVGKISFSIYLVHFVFFMALLIPAARELSDLTNGAIAVLVFYPVTFILSGLISVFTYRYIERPGIRLGSRLLNFLDATSSRQSSEKVDLAANSLADADGIKKDAHNLSQVACQSGQWKRQRGIMLLF